jgi:hypothetical protein
LDWVEDKYDDVDYYPDCFINTRPSDDDPQADILFGDDPNGDADIFFLLSCMSAQYCVWNNSGFGSVHGRQFMLWAGFHGLLGVGYEHVLDVVSYAENSRTSGVGENWLTEMHRDPISGYDTCPAAIVWGESPAARDDFYYDAGFDDRFDTGPHNASTYHVICDCDPEAGDPISCD